MRRPPDKEGQPTLSERDVESSNATLNTLFGGARQKSWMVGAGAPVRPTPRTTSSKTSVPQVALAQNTPMPVLPSPAPSDEPSPVLSNTPVNGFQNDRHGNGQREESRPSIITPSIRVPLVHSSEPDTQIPEETSLSESLDRSTSLSNSSHNQPTRSFTSPTALVESQSPPTMPDTNPPLPSSVLLPSDGQEEEQTLADAQSTPIEQQSSPILNRGFPQAQPLPARPGPVQSLNQGQQAPIPQAQSPDADSRQPQQSQIPRDLQGNGSEARFDPNTLLTPMALQSEARSYPSPSSVSAHPRKRQRIQPASMPSLKPRIALIQAHIQMSLPLGGLERPRYELLTNACNTEDAFYVALHQVFCCWDIDPNQIMGIQGYPNVQVLQISFRILGQLIRDNDALAPNHRKWFSEFPIPLHDLLQSSEPYRRTVGEVGTFLSRLASDWGALSQDCSTRGYPPLVDELVNRMGLLSPILQGVVFTASRRNLGIRDEEIGPRMEELFKKDQRDHQALAARYNTARPPMPKEVQERNRAVANQYILLHNELIQHRQRLASAAMMGSGPSVPTPILPSNDYNQAGTMNSPVPGPQQPVNQGNWNPNMPSPDPAGNWQFPNQQYPALQRTADGPSNPAMNGARPPGVGAQRVYTNTPSPTLLQGLSMHSPVQQNLPLPPVVRSNVQMQPQQNGSPHIGAQPNGPYFHSPLQQQFDPATSQRAHIAAQQPQIVAQFQQQNSNNQWVQNNVLQQQQAASIQQAVQQLQIQQELSRQVLNQNRAAQTRRESNPAVDNQRRNSSRNNTVVSNGYRTQSIHPMVGPPSGQLAPVSRRQQGASNEQIQADIMAYSQKHPLQRSFVPPLHYAHPSQPPNPEMTALHQAHIRSPRLVPADVPPSGISQDNPATRYYQAVRGFVLSPTRISSTTPLSKFDFTIPVSDFALIPNDIRHGNGQVATREFRTGTLQYRLRCVQAQVSDTKCLIADWVVSDTVWPESSSLAINRNHVEIRRKNHHGKDLPIDITAFVRLSAPNSTNQVTLSVLKGRSKMKEFNYFLAVEVIEILDHNQILRMANESRISATQTMNKIMKGLSAGGVDDDVAMVISDLSIDVADPFTSKIFKTPARGSSCLHRECFDLETFLLTRTSKPKRPEQPCMIDVWKCPLCNRDARPYSLQIDEFLESVRASLEKQGKLDDVKAILVGPDGSWRPKVEKRKATAGEDDSDYSSDGDGAFRRGSPKTSKPAMVKKIVEVIDLDD